MAKRRIKKRSKKPASVSSQKQGIIININSHNRKPVPKIVNNKPVPTPSSYPWGAKIITSSQPTVSLKDISDTIKSVLETKNPQTTNLHTLPTERPVKNSMEDELFLQQQKRVDFAERMERQRELDFVKGEKEMKMPTIEGTQYKCEQCDKTFPSMHGYKVHKSRIHK